jgi:chromosome segregation ATPase
LCHTRIERGGWKTIEDAVGAHSCSDKIGKERAKRGPMVTPAGGAGEAATVRPVVTGPTVTINEEYLRHKYILHGKKLEYPYNEDCSIKVEEAVDKVFEQAFRVEDLVKSIRQLTTDLKTAQEAAPTTSRAADPELILLMLKANKKYAAHISRLEEEKKQQAIKAAETNDEEGEPPLPYSPFDVIEQLVYDSKKFVTSEKQAEQRFREYSDTASKQIIELEGHVAKLDQANFQLQTELNRQSRQMTEWSSALDQHRAEIKRLQSLLPTEGATSVLTL